MPKPDGPQFETVYHSSWYEQPPHAWADEQVPSKYEDYGNASPTHIHMGTEKAARNAGFGRRYMHKYRVDRSQLHPVVYGDEEATEYDFHLLGPALDKKGVTQPELFENVYLNKDIMQSTKQPIAYRNNTDEDRGSISYVVPKRQIGKGKAVEYLGIEERAGWRGDLPNA